MIKDITKEIKAKKEAGAKKVRLVLITTIERNGRKIPQVVNIAEFEMANVFLKSGNLAAWIRNWIEESKGQYDSFKVEQLNVRNSDEDGAFERS